MTVYTEMFIEVLVLKLLDEMMTGYNLLLVVNFEVVVVKELNYKLTINLVLGMSAVSINMSKVNSVCGLMTFYVEVLIEVLVLGLVVEI